MWIENILYSTVPILQLTVWGLQSTVQSDILPSYVPFLVELAAWGPLVYLFYVYYKRSKKNHVKKSLYTLSMFVLSIILSIIFTIVCASNPNKFPTFASFPLGLQTTLYLMLLSHFFERIYKEDKKTP